MWTCWLILKVRPWILEKLQNWPLDCAHVHVGAVVYGGVAFSQADQWIQVYSSLLTHGCVNSDRANRYCRQIAKFIFFKEMRMGKQDGGANCRTNGPIDDDTIKWQDWEGSLRAHLRRSFIVVYLLFRTSRLLIVSVVLPCPSGAICRPERHLHTNSIFTFFVFFFFILISKKSSLLNNWWTYNNILEISYCVGFHYRHCSHMTSLITSDHPLPN